MKPKEIRAALMIAEVTIYKFARELGVSAALVHKVLNGDRKNPRVREKLAEAIGKQVSDIWPDQEAA